MKVSVKELSAKGLVFQSQRVTSQSLFNDLWQLSCSDLHSSFSSVYHLLHVLATLSTPLRRSVVSNQIGYVYTSAGAGSWRSWTPGGVCELADHESHVLGYFCKSRNEDLQSRNLSDGRWIHGSSNGTPANL